MLTEEAESCQRKIISDWEANGQKVAGRSQIPAKAEWAVIMTRVREVPLVISACRAFLRANEKVVIWEGQEGKGTL